MTQDTHETSQKIAGSPETPCNTAAAPETPHKIVALLSGGKDSTFSLLHCVKAGHEIVAVAHLTPPPQTEELDSYMYQSVGHNTVPLIARALGVPLYQAPIIGTPVAQGLEYTATPADEVEDLYQLLSEVKQATRCSAVCSGAIFSTYQKNRVEEVCSRLGLTSIAPLWELEQEELLRDMLSHNMEIRIIKVASMGLGKEHVGKYAEELLPHFLEISKKWGFNVCGEGGEYESLVTDCPLFAWRLSVDSSELVCHSQDDLSPVWYETFSGLSLVEKEGLQALTLRERLDRYIEGRS